MDLSPALAPERAAPRGLLGLLSFGAGLAVASLYYAQPLAARMAQDLGASERALGVALTATQAGYALGMLLLVPLGDARERRRLLVLVAAAAVPCLLLVSVARSVAALTVFDLALGITSSLPQLIVPFAVALVPIEARGRALGPVMSGLLSGILLSRVFSGWLGQLVGWRGVFVVAAALMALLALVLRWRLPRQEPPHALSWWATLRSMPALLRREPVLRRHALVGAMGFAAFSVFWSTLAFHLAQGGHGSGMAGLFGVVGLAGIVAAPIVGNLAHRIPARTINASSLVVAAASFGALWAGRASLLALGGGVALLDAGVQASHLANQASIFGLEPSARNRLNAVYMVTYFLGGALGTLVGTWAWGAAGWAGVCAAGGLLALLGIAPLWVVR